MANIHTYLKEIRAERGLTQEEVADRIGLTRQAVSAYESGKRQPGIDILMKLAEVYEVNIEAILYGKKDAGEKRKVKHAAMAAAAVFFFLQVLTGLLSTLSFALYPAAEGVVSAGQVELYKRHFELARKATAADRGAAVILCLGAIIVMAMDLSKRTRFSWKKKVGFCLAVFGVSWLIAIFWSIIHPVYGIMDFITRGPAHFASVGAILLIDLLVSELRRRKS